MSELSPIDNSVVELLRSSRIAREQEISSRAQALHEASKEVDATLTIEGLLLQECQNMMHSLTLREKYYLDANWFQKIRLKKFGQPALSMTMTVNGDKTEPSKAQARIMRMINLHEHKRFTVGNILANEAEMAEEGGIVQDWVVKTEPFFIHTYQRTRSTAHENLEALAPVHKISLIGTGVVAYEDGKVLEEDDLYLPLGIIAAANQKVKESVPRRVSNKWSV